MQCEEFVIPEVLQEFFIHADKGNENIFTLVF